VNSKPLIITAATVAGFMAITAATANYAKPTKYLADTRQQIKIEPSIPVEFAGWKQMAVSGGVVNPQQQVMLDAIYSELINRTYANDKGERVMVAIAYGKNQNDSLQVHRPESCYPAQGFQLQSNRQGEVITPFGLIPVRRIETVFGPQRPEPVTYWITIGDEAVRNNTEKKIKEIQYAMKGYLADGLLFRLSSIDPDSERAFEIHQRFIQDLLQSLKQEDRKRLAGLSG
jgi:EpsI family protein